MFDDSYEIGQRIKERRLALDLTQEELADKTGYQSKSTINKIESGKRGVKDSKLNLFADVLQTTPGYLTGWTDDPINYDLVADEIPLSYIELTHGDVKKAYTAMKAVDEDVARENEHNKGLELIYGKKKDKSSGPIIIDDSTGKQVYPVNEDPYANKPNRIKVYGSVPASIPLEANEDIIGWEDIPEEWLYGDRQFFGLRVQGDSMEPEYRAGDIIIVLKQPDCESGQDAVVYVNGYEATLKRVFKQQFGILLQPLNPKYEPRFYDYGDEYNPVVIVGIVREIRRRVNW